MAKLLSGIIAVALLITACADDQAASSITAPPTTTTTIAASTTTPSTTTPPDDNQGGFGTPAQRTGEFSAAEAPRPVRGELVLAESGCWFVDFEFTRHLVVFPLGHEIAAGDTTVVVGADGTSYTSGSVIDGTANEVQAADLPGGADGYWGNYVAFCTPTEPAIAVFDTMQPAFDPTTLTDGDLAGMIEAAVFTKSWPCGRGWAASTDDERVALYLYQQGDEALAAGAVIELPSDTWSTEVVVGMHLFVNHCDDVFEAFEPTPVMAAPLPLTAGSIEVVDSFPTGFDSATVSARLTGATVSTPGGIEIALDPQELSNRSFNFFAG